MHDDRKLVEERIEHLRSRVADRVYQLVQPISAEAWQVPGEPVSFDEARRATYQPLPNHTPWGPAWSTWWLKLCAQLAPEQAHGRLELRVDLGFEGDWAGNQAEGMVYTADGYPLKAVNPMNRTVPLTFGAEQRRLLADDGSLELYVEAAANPNLSHMIGQVTPQGDTQTRTSDPVWQYRGAEIVRRDDDVWGLHLDLDVLDGLMRQLPTDATWRAVLLRGLEAACDALDQRGIQPGAAKAREILRPLLASGAANSAQRMTAVGHAHIDTAWLWPIRETRRKAVRTFSNVVTLMEEYPQFRYANSVPQHHLWVAEDQPEVAKRVRAAMERGQWQFVGGMWVEPDATMPSGESLVRQFTCGLRYMRDAWGQTTDCLWLPDSFGYGAQLPQIARLAGMQWFFTQKLSWNRINRIPHNTLWWEGLDGTRIWTHFPPCNCYDSIVSAEDVLGAEREFKEKGYAKRSLLPYGYGDGGGGPVREMVERVDRFADLEGAPVVEHGSPSEFFARAREEFDPQVWAGELYLEFHRGIFTSLLKLKQGNRRSEALLQAVEWLATLAQQAGAEYPSEQLEQVWRRVLMLQFHDILPGSSVAWVNREAIAEYDAILAELGELLDAAWCQLGSGDGYSAVNPSDVARAEVVSHEQRWYWVEVPAFGSARLSAADELPVDVTPVTVNSGETCVLENGLVRVEMAADGTISSLLDVVNQRELVMPGRQANVLRLHPDHPSCFDAWELEEQYRHSAQELRDGTVQVVEQGPLRACVAITRRVGDSSITQQIALTAGSRSVQFAVEADWQERERLLKASFPLDIRAAATQAETQFGHVTRAVSDNTTWDHARFEMCAHRWIRVEEPGYAAALALNSGYGYDAQPAGGSEAHATSGVEVGLSLLRGPNSPDPEADKGQHRIEYSLTCDATIADAHRAGLQLNQPLRVCAGQASLTAPATVEPLTPHSFAVIDAICPAHSGGTLIRLHEAAGARSRIRLTLPQPAVIREVDLMEREHRTQNLPEAATNQVELQLRPFQIVTLIVRNAQ